MFFREPFHQHTKLDIIFNYFNTFMFVNDFYTVRLKSFRCLVLLNSLKFGKYWSKSSVSSDYSFTNRFSDYKQNYINEVTRFILSVGYKKAVIPILGFIYLYIRV